MTYTSSTLINAGVYFLFIFLSGFWLSRSGKPYNMFIITVHKLIGLAVGVSLGTKVDRAYQMNAISSFDITAILITIVLFVALVTTGSLLSAEKPMPEFVTTIHKILPYITFLATGITVLTFP